MLINNALGAEGVLLRLRNLIPCSAKLQLYKSAILPHLTYCGIVWHFCKSSDKRKLERIQERALRAVFKSRTESYSVLLKKASLPTLYQRRLQGIATLTLTFLTLEQHTTVNTRCVFFGPLLWGKLNSADRERSSLNSFKQSINKKDLTILIDECKKCDECTVLSIVSDH